MGLITSLLGAYQTAQNYHIAQNNFKLQQQNYDLQKDAFQFQKDSYLKNFEYQKSLQNQIFGREDNAVQRRVADLQSAGLSKTLAAGDGAGAGSVVSTSPFSGSFNGQAPHMSQVDLVSTGLQIANAMANFRQMSAQTENTLKQNEVMDSQILNDQVNRNYTAIKAAIEQGNLDMLGLTREQKIASIRHTNALIRSLDEQIEASIQNRTINNYKLSTLLPAQYDKTVQEIANLKKQGAYYDADLVYKNLQSDLLVQSVNKELFLSKIAELDYYFQQKTGFKPRSAMPFVNEVGATLTTDGAKNIYNFIKDSFSRTITGFQNLFNFNK